MIISFFGLPGSGKTTVSKIVAQRLGLKHLSVGDVARDLATRDEETRIALADGRVAPRDKLRNAVIDRLRPNLVLDGFPRYMEQLADLFYATRGFSNCALLSVALECTVEEATCRMAQRGRSDDNTVAIARRLDTYRRETLPVVNYLYRAHEDTTILVPQLFHPADAAAIITDHIQSQF